MRQYWSAYFLLRLASFARNWLKPLPVESLAFVHFWMKPGFSFLLPRWHFAQGLLTCMGYYNRLHFQSMHWRRGIITMYEDH